jgi:hypothetical protein
MLYQLDRAYHDLTFFFFCLGGLGCLAYKHSDLIMIYRQLVEFLGRGISPRKAAT